MTVRADGSLVLKVKAPPREGRANEAVARVVAKHLGLSKGEVRVVAGHKSRAKIVEVPDGTLPG